MSGTGGLQFISTHPSRQGSVDARLSDSVSAQGVHDTLYFNGTVGTLVATTVVDVDLTSTGSDADGNVFDRRSIRAAPAANSPTYVGVLTADILTQNWGVVRRYGPVQANLVAALAIGSGVITSGVAGQFAGVAAPVNHRLGYTTTTVVANVATVFLTG